MMIATVPDLPPPPPSITIFVHGTQHAATGWIPKYASWAYNFTHHQDGLHRALDIPHDYLYTHLAKHLEDGDSKKFPLEHTYIFCWSGALSHTARLKAASELNKALNELVKKHTNPPHITIITHSHGGNVVLNIMNIEDEKEYIINTLIMTANPVQTTTKECAEDDTIIKEILAPHSHGDYIQVAAPQQHPDQDLFKESSFTSKEKIKNFLLSWLPPFSQRHFPKNSRVKHIKITCNGTSLSHIGFLLPSFTTTLGKIIDQAHCYDFSKEEMVYDIKPLSSDFLQFWK